jgi:hypothetical protein
MSDHAQWLAANKAYLQDYIRWVQLRLERYIASLPVAPTPQPLMPRVETKKPSWFGFGKSEQAITAPLPNAYDSDAINTELEKMSTLLSAAESQEPPPAAVILARQFGLSRFERDILMLCAALELDGKTAALCAKAALAARPYPTFALALQVFAEAEWDALAAHRPLRYWRLIEINQPGAEPLVTSALRADERVVAYLVEPQHQLDDRLQAFVTPLPASDDQPLAASQRKQVRQLKDYLDRQQAAAASTINIQLTGVDSAAKVAIARQALAPLGIDLVQLNLASLPGQPAELEQLLRLWGRERLLLPVALFLDTHPLEAGEHSTQEQVLQRLANAGGIVIIASRDLRPELDGFNLDVVKPLATEQLQAWQALLGEKHYQLARQLAGQFSLDIGSIDNLAREAIALDKEAANQGEHLVDGEASQAPVSLNERLWQACLAKTSPRLDQLAQRLETKATWEQLVLPEDSLKLLRQVCDQVEQRMQVYGDWGFGERMNRGMGLSVLFAGESGTGKTMAAEVLANALKLHLYRIDLSAVVSKYIGETEKNLCRLFDAAEDGGAILFFDEADALFGKRSEVKDSHDRYANIEINYLLQRIEAYRGLAILATNVRSALDQAFMRRLRFILSFQFPAAAQRADIWRKVFPAATPLGELDYQHLGRFNLTGGSIHNIALNAAFLAAGSSDRKITMPLVLDAIRSEMRKLDKPVNEAEFRQMGVAGGS